MEVDFIEQVFDIFYFSKNYMIHNTLKHNI